MAENRYVEIETIDETGRYVTPQEFKWIMDSFPNPLNPLRLAFGLAYSCGLRIFDAVNAKRDWFDDNFSCMAMSQCKANVSKKDGVTRARKRPKTQMLPAWLSEELRAYMKYSAVVKWKGYNLAVGEQGTITDRLFPFLSTNNAIIYFHNLRKRHGHEQKWLCDIYQINRIFEEKGGRLLKETKLYRVATHGFRAAFCTMAFEFSGGNLQTTKAVTGHSQTRHLERYAKTFDANKRKLQIKKSIEKDFGLKVHPVKVNDILKVEVKAIGSKGDGLAWFNGFLVIVDKGQLNAFYEVKIYRMHPTKASVLRQLDESEFKRDKTLEAPNVPKAIVHESKPEVSFLGRRMFAVKRVNKRIWHQFKLRCSERGQPICLEVERIIEEYLLKRQGVLQGLKPSQAFDFSNEQVLTAYSIQNLDQAKWTWFTKLCKHKQIVTGQLLCHLIEMDSLESHRKEELVIMG